MRKFTKKAFCIFTAAVLTAGALSLTACGKNAPTVTLDKSGNVQSNGGFVVSTNDYYYFINGVQNYSADNTYGDVVKGALMRVKKGEVKENKAETVIPSLMVAGDYTAGIFIYGERIYYATPNNVKNTTGVVENDYLDFKSAKTDGSGITDILRVKDNTTQYRYVEVDGTVYLVYVNDKELHSLNTATNQDTVLVKGADSYTFNQDDKTDPYVYYTMGVTDAQDTESAISYKYNQIYRVSVDATEESAPKYEWNQDWLDKNNNGEVPYWNYGELVLDGIGSADEKTQFNPDAAADLSNVLEFGFTYTLQNYTNDGIYFKRADVYSPSEDLSGLYYLPIGELGDGWNTVTGNNDLDKIANSTNLSKASADALYYTDNEGQHYLYVSGSNIYRADVKADGSNEQELQIAFDASGAQLLSIDTTSDSTYDYVYYTRSNNGGLSVERAVINGEEENYKNLQQAGAPSNKPFEPVKLLNVQHTSGWYNYEILDNMLFYANNESFGSSLDYVYTVDLKGADDKLMNNEQIQTFNEKYESIFSTDKKVGYLEEVKDKEDNKDNVPNALKYYFYTGETTLVWENIQDALDAGKKESYVTKNLYSEAQQEKIKAFTAENSEERAERFTDENGKDYFTQSYFTNMLGEMNKDDAEAYNDYWKTSVLKHYDPVEDETNDGLAWWAWLLIALAIAAVVAGVGVGAHFYLKKHKKEAPKPERMRVDTTDDKDVDVYNVNAETSETAEEAPVEENEESAEEPAEAPKEEAEEPVEEAAEPEEVAEEPAQVPEEEAAAEEPQGENNPYNE